MPGTAALARGAGGAGGNKGFAIAHLEGHPTERDAQPAIALFIDVERVLAAQVHGARRRRIDHEFARRGPDEGVQFAALQGEAFAARGAQYRVRRQVHAADLLGFQTYGRITGAHGLPLAQACPGQLPGGALRGGRHHQHQRRGGSDQGGSQRPRRTRRAREAAVPVAQRREALFQARDLQIRRTGTVPQIIVVHFVSSNSRNIFIPRHKLTRTDSCVSPV